VNNNKTQGLINDIDKFSNKTDEDKEVVNVSSDASAIGELL
jgi:hypothetical protein